MFVGFGDCDELNPDWCMQLRSLQPVYQENCLSIEELMLGNELHLMCIIPLPWKHRGGNWGHVQEKNTYSKMLFILLTCVCEREEFEIIKYSEQRYDLMINVESKFCPIITYMLNFKK